MRQFLMRCVWIAALAVPGLARAETPQAQLTALAEAYDRGECDLPKLRHLVERPDFGALPGAGRSLGFAMLGFCDPASRRDMALKATAEGDALSFAWSLKFYDAAQAQDSAGAAQALHEAAARKADGTLILYEDAHVSELVVALRSDAGRLRAVLADLDRADWRPGTPYLRGDWLWSMYVGLLLDAGDIAEARRVAARIIAPEELVKMRLDGRFAPLVAEAPERFDIRAATERVLNQDLSLLAKNPDDGIGVSAVAGRLRMLERPQEALALLDARLAKPGPIPDERGNDMRAWLFDSRAVTLEQMGRFDESLAMRRQAAYGMDGKDFNVGTAMNLAVVLVRMEHYEEALSTLTAFDGGRKPRLSAFGRMQLASMRACANLALGRRSTAEQDLAYTAVHAADAWGVRTYALMCADDLDGAAQAYIARLEGPTSRLGGLLALSDFKPSPYRTAFQRELDARFEAVRARPDVQAAIAKAGRVDRFDIVGQLESEMY